MNIVVIKKGPEMLASPTFSGFTVDGMGSVQVGPMKIHPLEIGPALASTYRVVRNVAMTSTKGDRDRASTLIQEVFSGTDPDSAESARCIFLRSVAGLRLEKVPSFKEHAPTHGVILFPTVR